MSAIKFDISDKNTLFFAKATTLFDHQPNFEEIQEGSANCRYDLNKENPKAIIHQVIAYVKYNGGINKYILFTEIGFKNG